jgi:hypothetical protein
MSNITNTCLYQACTKSPTYHHRIHMCINHAPTPVPYQASTMYTTTCNMCINHVPSPVPYHASTITSIYQPCQPSNHTSTSTMYQPCTSTMYINTIPCTNHIPYHAIHHIPINQDMNQQCISPSRPQPTCTMHPMMCLKSYTKAHKHMPLACSSISPRCNLITQYTKPQVCTITCNQTIHQDSQ